MIPKSKKILKLFRHDGGSVTVELALIMTTFMVVILVGWDFSRMAVEKHRLDQFARAGTQYGLLGQTEAQDTAGVIAAVKTAAGADADDITVSADSYCGCSGSGSSDCDDTCADDSVPNLYLAVTVTKKYDYMMSFAADIGGEVNLEGTSTVRVR